MKIQPFFSLCIPVYNSGAICEKAIETALQQNFDDYEMVLVDDCSTDNSFEVLTKFANNNEKIRLFKNEKNIGMTANWDKCLQLAAGKFIGFVHHDDAISNTFLKDAFEIISQNPSIGILAFLNQNATKRPIMGFIDSKTYFKYTFSIVNIPPPSETIFRKTPTIGYDSEMIYCPEVDVYLRLSRMGYDAFHSDKVNVTRNPSGWTGSVTARRQYNFDRFQDYLYIIKKWKNDDWITRKDVSNLYQRIADDILKRYVRGKTLGIKEANELLGKYKSYLVANHDFGLTEAEKFRIMAQILPQIILKGITSLGFRVLKTIKK